MTDTNSSQNRQLGVFSLATLLVSAHYGLGFVLGTGEKALTLGAAGSLYPVCLGLGTLALLALAKLYWTEVEPVWTLLGSRYGDSASIAIGVMAWSSLLGIQAVQILSGAFILKVAGVPVLLGMGGLTIAIAAFSLLPVERASWIFKGLLSVNFAALLYSLWALNGIDNYVQTTIAFVPALERMEVPQIVGIACSTIPLVLIDMKYQQYLVRAQTPRVLYQGCAIAGVALLALAFLPSAVVVSARESGILPSDIDAKEAIPYILSWLGGGASEPVGRALLAVLLVPALGIGSAVLRIQTKTVLDFEVLPPANWSRVLVTLAQVSLGFAVALKGGAIVNLIACFYAAYVGATWVPLIAYLLARARRYEFASSSVRLSLFAGSTAALATLAATIAWPDLALFDDAELTIIAIALGIGLLGLSIGEVVEKTAIASAFEEDT